MLNISVTTPKGNTSPIECTIDSCSIGKSDENLIVLQGWTVAKKHAAIQRKPDGVYVEDLGSSSGTEVNGQKISRKSGGVSNKARPRIYWMSSMTTKIQF